MHDPSLDDILSSASLRRTRLGLEDVRRSALPTFPPTGLALARLYMLQLSDAPEGDALEGACVAAMIASSAWSELLVEALTNLPLSARMARIIIGALAARAPDHPLARRHPAQGAAMQKAFDAVDDGERLQLNLTPDNQFGNTFAGCLVSIENPATVWATCSLSARTKDTVWLDVDRSSPLFAEQRFVLPPAVLIAVAA